MFPGYIIIPFKKQHKKIGEIKMNKKLTLIIILIISFITFSFGKTENYEADKFHSSISFTINHMVVSKVTGHFNDFSVFISVDPSDITKSVVTASIKTASIDTGNDKRDTHLRSADFFDVGKFPDITFKSSKIEKKGNDYVMKGSFTMHGITKEIEIPFKINGHIKDYEGKIRAGIEAQTSLDRKDYGLVWNKTLDQGGLVVGNEVKVEILLEMVSK